MTNQAQPLAVAQANNAPAARPKEQKPSAVAVMAARMSVEPSKLFQTLKDTVFKNANESEMLALVVVANEYGLNPLLKEIYAFPAQRGGIVPVVSVDGWISLVNRQKLLDGIKFAFEDKGGKPYSCTCTISIKGRERPVEVTEFYDECFRNTDPWKQMPRRMLRHKALIQTARVAFGFSGIYDEDEGNDQHLGFENAKPAVVLPEPEVPRQPINILPDEQPATPPAAAPAVETPIPAYKKREAKENVLDELEARLEEEKISEQDFAAWVEAKEYGEITPKLVRQIILPKWDELLVDLRAFAKAGAQ